MNHMQKDIYKWEKHKQLIRWFFCYLSHSCIYLYKALSHLLSITFLFYLALFLQENDWFWRFTLFQNICTFLHYVFLTFCFVITLSLHSLFAFLQFLCWIFVSYLYTYRLSSTSKDQELIVYEIDSLIDDATSYDECEFEWDQIICAFIVCCLYAIHLDHPNFIKCLFVN